MGRLQDLIDARFASYSEHSDKILRTLQANVLPAILDILELSDNEESKLIWRDVRIINNHILVTGQIEYAIGDIIKDNDTTVTLTEQTASLMSKFIKVAIPLPLAETATTEEIKQHLTETQRQLREEYEAAYGHDKAAFEEAMRGATNEQLGWSELTPEILDSVLETVTEFEIEDLTETQLKSLMLTHLSQHKRGKLN